MKIKIKPCKLKNHEFTRGHMPPDGIVDVVGEDNNCYYFVPIGSECSTFMLNKKNVIIVREKPC